VRPADGARGLLPRIIAGELEVSMAIVEELVGMARKHERPG